MKFRLTWRSKETGKHAAGQWQDVRPGIEAWCEALNASTTKITYALEFAEGYAEPFPAAKPRKLFDDLDRESL
jgi:hypothetical protein